MGGDHGPVVTVAAALSFLAAEPNAELFLVGNEDAIASELKKQRGDSSDHTSKQAPAHRSCN